MKEWWQGLSIREQLIVLGGGIVAALILFYLLIWGPFTGHIQSLQQQASNNENLLRWMATAEKQIQQLRNTAPPSSTVNPANLLNVVDQSARQNKLNTYITQLAQADNSKVDVKFNQVPFDDLAKWLTQLWQQHSIQVDEMTASPKGNGVVQAEIVLTAS